MNRYIFTFEQFHIYFLSAYMALQCLFSISTACDRPSKITTSCGRGLLGPLIISSNDQVSLNSSILGHPTITDGDHKSGSQLVIVMYDLYTTRGSENIQFIISPFFLNWKLFLWRYLAEEEFSELALSLWKIYTSRFTLKMAQINTTKIYKM